MHPLDPLSVDEVSAACRIAKDGQGLGDDVRYVVVVRREPEKEELARWQPGQSWDRQAELTVLDRRDGMLYECVVSLTAEKVTSWQPVPGARPPLLFGEALEAILAVKADAGWQEAIRKRGITDLDSVQVDPWPAGNFNLPDEAGRRLTRCVSYVRETPADNGYAHPIEGLVAVVDLGQMSIIELIDTGVVPIPPEPGNYDPTSVGQLVGQLRTDLKPVAITQPEGPSFALNGNEVLWQRWRLRFSVHPVEGLVLHTISYDGRSILHRASIAEMVVPYGATGAAHWWKNAFDAGEWGLGRMMQSLTNGCDCLGEIRYADAVMADETGGANLVSNAVCMHEEDFGIGWKHVDGWTGSNETRRSRRFVISAISTVGNYDYGFYWYFYLDGTIQLEVKLTGIMQTAAVAPGEDPDHAAMIAPQLAAPHHQHLFCCRLDMDLDGTANSVLEVDAVPEPSPQSNAFEARVTVLDRESNAQRMADPAAGRVWKIVNPGVINRLGQPVGYRLIPAPPVTLLAGPNARVTDRARFATRNLWVTPYRPDERRPAGEYANQSEGGDGLPAWTAADRPIENTDVVLWHSFGVTHIARPEDWPVMPVEYTGFMLKPDGFFDRNPALDVPPSPEHCSSGQ